jgi:uncharacterized protein YkwD
MGPPRHRGLEMRRGLVRIVAVAALTTGLAATTVGASTPANAQLRRAKMLAWVNHSRVEHHVPQLRMVRSVVGLAHAHNVAMAQKDRLFHTSDLGYKLRYVDWHSWGENVGAGVTPYGLFKAYMASPEHRANMLSTGFRRVGINFVQRRGILWSTLIFYG